MKRIKSSRILCKEEIVSGYLYFEEGKILEVSQRELPVEQTFDAGDAWVSPGFIDIHTHGGGGFSFAGSVEEIVEGCNFHLHHGTTSICPTISAAPMEEMARCAANVAQAMVHPQLKSHIIGTHMEGPYLSAAQAGAQAPAFLTAPVREEYLPVLEKCGDAIARWSYAPENDGDDEFCKALAQYGVVASAGHTDASYRDMKSAMDQGCNLVTHLYSCTSTITRDHGFRIPGVIETAYLEDDLYAEVIADGRHLPPELLRMIWKIKGTDRLALITDSMAIAGTNVTRGRMQSTEYIVEDGVCKLLDRSAFAGSVATADRLLQVAVQDAKIPLADAVKMLTTTPAKIMGLKYKGSLAPGGDADMVIFDDSIRILQVFAAGEPVITGD